MVEFLVGDVICCLVILWLLTHGLITSAVAASVYRENTVSMWLEYEKHMDLGAHSGKSVPGFGFGDHMNAPDASTEFRAASPNRVECSRG